MILRALFALRSVPFTESFTNMGNKASSDYSQEAQQSEPQTNVEAAGTQEFDIGTIDGISCESTSLSMDVAKSSLPFRGIIQDLKNRIPYYVSDWTDGFAAGPKIIAPATYIFFASVIPALTFGQQLYEETDGTLSVVHVLMSTAISGLTQALIGGQPLLIVGVAEPIILIYGFIYTYAKNNDIDFMPWATVILIYTALFQFIIAAANWCDFINRFTRFSGEIFGILIACLFLQQAVKGLVEEFDVHSDHRHRSSRNLLATSYSPNADAICSDSNLWAWRQVNGIFSTTLALLLLLTSILCRTARSWRFLTGGSRRFLSEYGPPLMVLLWTLISYTPDSFPKSVPRRVSTKDLDDSQDGWSVLTNISKLDGGDWGTAVVPAVVITALFYFDHNVSAQLASVDEFRLKKPSSYHWDFFLQGCLTLTLGFFGLPPTNGVLPQAPLHTRSLMIRRSKNSRKTKVKQMEVVENRVSGLLQSLLCAIMIFLVPVIKKIPTALLWGYFALMSYESLPGNEMFYRTTILFTDPKKLQSDPKILGPFKDVKYKTLVQFTIAQIVLLGCVWGVTQAGLAGVSFPLFIMALVPIREKLLPIFFTEEQLDILDSSEGSSKQDHEESGMMTNDDDCHVDHPKTADLPK